MLKLFKKQAKEPVRFYLSCDNLPIYHFHKIMETSDYRYLIVSWDEYSKMEFDEQRVVEVWGSIYNEYCLLTSNNKALMYYKNRQKLMFLETRNEVCGKMIVQMAIRNMKKEMFLEYIKTLRNFKVPYEKDVKDVECLETASRFLKGSINEIELLRNEIENMVETGEHVPFEKEIISVEQSLGRNVIDPKTTSVKKWIFMIEKIREMAEEQRKRNLARKNG